MRRAIYQLLPRGVSSCGVGQVQLKAKSSSAKSNWSSKIATRCKRRLISAERQVQLEVKNSRERDGGYPSSRSTCATCASSDLVTWRSTVARSRSSRWVTASLQPCILRRSRRGVSARGAQAIPAITLARTPGAPGAGELVHGNDHPIAGVACRLNDTVAVVAL